MNNPTLQPLISVIIPVYKVESYLSECINSVMAQTYKNWKLILVDDGSPDKSGDICDDYAKLDARITVIHKENGGASDARNYGIKHATGDYIIFLDGDDYFCDTKCFEKCCAKLARTPYDFLLFKSQKAFVEQNLFVDYYGDFDPEVFKTNDSAEIFKYMVRTHKQLACPWNKIIKRDLFLKNDLSFIKGTIGEDIEWIIRLFESSERIGCLNEIVHSYRQEVTTSVTAAMNEKKVWDLFNLINNIAIERKEKSDPLSRAILSFMAFEYAILLYTIATFNDITPFMSFKNLDWILKYTIDKKSFLIKCVYRVLGFNNTIKLLRKARRFI